MGRASARRSPPPVQGGSLVPPALFSDLAFRYAFRKYQRLILEAVDADQEDWKYHLVAPPGAGKTVIGLELIRRFGAPAVVFAPTTTIQQQWQEQVRLFPPVQGRSPLLQTLTSTDPAYLPPINIFTYQVISTPGEARELTQHMAVERW